MPEPGLEIGYAAFEPMTGDDTSSREAPFTLSHHDVTSADGTRIAAHWSAAKDPEGGPVVVLAADLAESVPEVWRPQLAYLSTHRRGLRFVTWEYRGTGASSAPAHGRYDVAAHLEDLCAVLTAAGVAPAWPCIFVATGVGVRLALETALVMPERVGGLVLIGGAAGWRYQWLCRAARLASLLARHGEAKRPHAALVAAATHGVDQLMHYAEMSLLAEATEPVGTLHAVARSLGELGTESVVEQARSIEQPALVLCGEDDPRMPAAVAHQLGRHLNRSRVKIVPRSSSRLAARLPDLVNLEIERFFDEVLDRELVGAPILES